MILPRTSKISLSLALLAGAAVAAESPAGGGKATPPSDARLNPEQVAASVRASLDPEADPCRDFYRYACGGWLDQVELPGDQSRWGRSFSEITERNRAVLRETLDQAARMSGDVEEYSLIGDYYGACMDEAAVEKAGPTPLRPMLRRISGISGPESLMKVVAALHRVGVGPFWSLGVFPDFKDPDANLAQVLQGGLGMPDRDYYLDEDKRPLLEAYEAHVAAMLGHLALPEKEANEKARSIVALETRLAEASLSRTERRNPERIYHKVDVAGLEKLAPELPWGVYLEALGVPGLTDLNVGMPGFMERVQEVILESDPDALKAYLRWHLLHDTADYLSSDIVQADFDFYGKKLSGRKELQPRWKRCVRDTDAAIGEALAQAYIERQFAGDSREKAVEMILEIEEAFAANLKGLAWMDGETRRRAAAKMKAIRNKIGYPDEWRDYSSLRIKPDRYLANALEARKFEFNRDLGKIGEPVDADEWFMTPPQVNAYYNPLFNEMVFPAGILQPPFFHRDFPAAMNFGGIGMVMGHELTHGFDDSGRKFDPEGRLREWWDPAVAERFEERAQCVSDLYASFEVEEGLNLNGELTLGENIADLGGIKQAYGAYRSWAGEHGEPESPVEGLGSDQLFFVGFAQTWCSVAAPEFRRMLVTVDTHSPSRFRVNGPLSQFEAFAEAFQCEEGTPMHPEETCEVW